MVDTIMDGIEGMRLAGEIYLPSFADEDTADYNYRLQTTKMTNVFSDITEGLAAKPFEQNVTFSEAPPAEIETFSWDVDGSGNTITGFAAETFHSAIVSALDWIFVDHDKLDPSIRTMADAQAAGIRPYWTHVRARNVIDVRSQVVRGVETLTYIKIFEPGDPDHIREFERAADGAISWRLYVKTDTDHEMPGNPNEKTKFAIEESGDLTIDEIPLVPFFTGRRIGRSWRFVPAMQAAAELQIELFQSESGLKFAKTLTGYPMLAANGITPPKGPDGKPVLKVAVGPNRVLWSQADANGNIGNWGYIQPGSESLKFLADDIEATIRQLRELGRQPLTAMMSNITVITAAVAAGKARSSVKAWAYMLGNALEEALLITAKFMGLTYDPSVSVFTEFDEFTEGEDLDALNNARDRNDISRETLWEELQRRNVLSSNFTAEREQGRLLRELPGDVTDEGTGDERSGSV